MHFVQLKTRETDLRLDRLVKSHVIFVQAKVLSRSATVFLVAYDSACKSKS